MDNDVALDEVKLKFEEWEAQNIIISLKMYNGKYQIDARKWFDNGSQNIPTAKGLSLNPNQWARVISNISDLLIKNNLMPKDTSTQNP